MNKQNDSRSRSETLDEYRNLLSLYAHEDDYLTKVLQVSILLNGLLATIAKIGATNHVLNLAFAGLGIVSCFAWHRMAEAPRETRTYETRSF